MDIYILADGLSEDPRGKTSLMQSRHGSLDKLTLYGKLGFYEPIIKPFHENPETFIVFPYFFGLSPDLNPGRAGLELFASGIDISLYNSFCIVRIVKKEYNIFDVVNPFDINTTWTSISEIDCEENILSIFNEIESLFPTCKSVKSKNRNNVWSLGAKTKNDLELMITLLQFQVNKLGYNVYPMMFDFVGSHLLLPCFTGKEITILGWCVSTLLEAFLFLGISNGQLSPEIKEKLFNYNFKLRDFDENIMPRLKEGKKESFILFIKEPSRAARENSTNQKKIESIEFIDKIVGRILEEFSYTDTNIILLSDHQSNIGNKKTYSGPTLYYYGNLLQPINSVSKSFSEENAGEEILLQEELANHLQNFIIQGINKK